MKQGFSDVQEQIAEWITSCEVFKLTIPVISNARQIKNRDRNQNHPR